MLIPPLDIRGGEGLTIRPFHAGAQGKGPLGGVGIHLPGFGNVGAQPQILVKPDQA